jgi:hypothetical protein
MKKLVLVIALVLACGPALAVSYSNDFEGDTPGTLPGGWYIAQWWNDPSGTVQATVEAAPGGGQALRIVWPTDWASYTNSNGETGYTLDMTGINGEAAALSYQFDMWVENWRVWRAAGDQTWFPPGGIHMNDNPAGPNEMHVGDDAAPPELTDVPEGQWVHVCTTFNSLTNQWGTIVSYTSGSGGGIFSGTTENPVAGEIWFGGWAFQTTMDAAPVPPGGEYDNVWYIDNFCVSVTGVPEPGILLLSGLGLLAFLRRKR